jgi:hypothetical protein
MTNAQPQQPQRSAVDWIERALRIEISLLQSNGGRYVTDAELRELAETFDAIARHWRMPTEQAVSWIHSQSKPNVTEFKAYCVVRHAEELAAARGPAAEGECV